MAFFRYCRARAQIYVLGQVKITRGTVEFIDHWPVREPGKSRIICISLQFVAVVSIVLFTKRFLWHSSISVNVTPNNSHSAVVCEPSPVSVDITRLDWLNTHTPQRKLCKTYRRHFSTLDGNAAYGHSLVLTIRIKSLFFGTVSPSGIFCRLNIVPLDRDDGSFNSGESYIFWWLLHYTGVLRWRKDPHSTWTEMALFWQS